MTTEEKKPIEFYRSQPERYQILRNGAVRDRTKSQSAIVAIFPELNPYTITAEKSAEFQARRKQVGMIAQMRALARAEGIELPDDIKMDELLVHAASGVEALYIHAIKTFLASKNIRGMGEIIPKLVAGFIETDSRAREMDAPPAEIPAIFILLNQYINQLQGGKEDNSKAVDGEILEEQKGG